MADDIVEQELEVEYSDALLPTVQLINASAFYLPLLVANEYIGDVGGHPDHLRTILRDYDCELSIDTVYPPGEMMASTLAFGQLADAFLSFLSELWGLDRTQALMVLSQTYDVDFSSDQTGWWEDLISIGGIIVAAAGLATIFIPGVGAGVSVALLVAGASLNSASVLIDANQGEISPEAAATQLAIIAAFSAAGAYSISSGGILAGRLPGLLSSPAWADFVESITFAGADALVGATNIHGSDPESLAGALEWLQTNLGLNDAESRELLSNIGHYMIEGNNNPYNVSESLLSQYGTRPIPDYEGVAGPVIDSGRPGPTDLSGVGIDFNAGETGARFYDFDDVQRVYPDFIAWMDIKHDEYLVYSSSSASNTTFIEFVDRYFNGPGHSSNHAPSHYEDLLHYLDDYSRWE